MKERDRAYKRDAERRERKRRMEIAVRSAHAYAGYTDWERRDGCLRPTGTYVKYPKSTGQQKYWKTRANRAVRGLPYSLPKGNRYRKCAEYRWEID